MILIPENDLQTDFQEVKFTEDIKGKSVNFTLLKYVDHMPSFSSVTSAAVVPFLSKNMLVATRLKRGVDIPGGHTESHDVNALGTIAREAKEEAGVELILPVYLTAIIVSDYYGPLPTDITYMLVTVGKVKELKKYNPILESLGREPLSPDKFLDLYKGGSQAMMEEIIERSKTVSDEVFSW